ncbi:MAG: nitrous oxide reductase, partial [Flavobacteriaceae bacterium]|nr:nitrous oxide reductase [Flavobacteriaceae bacterium]
MKKLMNILVSLLFLAGIFSCNTGDSTKSGSQGALTSNAAEKVYVAPGEYDEFYAFVSGGFSGQLAVYGLPSGRLFKVIPVFSQDAEKAYGYNEETKPMLNTSHGFIPWDDSHHPDISQTNGVLDGRWVFINGNNTPRIAKIDLTTFETTEIIEVPNS